MLKEIRKRQLSQLANSIADHYSANGLLNPETIADANSITYSYGEYGSFFDGMLEHFSGEFHIYINLEKLKAKENVRTRFTFAHELGHFFIDEHRISLKNGKTPPHQSLTNFSSKNLVEVEADFFAASLLMPDDLFRNNCKGKAFSPGIIRFLADKYQTSLSATAIRYADIGHTPITVVCSKNRKVLWHWKSKDFPFEYIKGYSEGISPATVAGEFFRTGKQYLLPEEVFVEDWFQFVDLPGNTIKMYESCIYAPQQNFVMSFIWLY